MGETMKEIDWSGCFDRIDACIDRRTSVTSKGPWLGGTGSFALRRYDGTAPGTFLNVMLLGDGNNVILNAVGVTTAGVEEELVADGFTVRVGDG